MTRDQFIQKLKTDLNRWSEQIDAWEGALDEADGRLRARLQPHLDAWRDQRSLTEHRLREMQLSSGAAWEDTARRVDRAWHDLADAYHRAREEFESRTLH